MESSYDKNLDTTMRASEDEYLKDVVMLTQEEKVGEKLIKLKSCMTCLSAVKALFCPLVGILF